MKKLLKNILAIFCMLLGFIGGFIPVLQGWVFVLIGFILLDFEKKYVIEQKIIDLLLKFKLTRKLGIFWLKVKHRNKKMMNPKEQHTNFSNLYNNIDKDIDNKN